MHPYRLFDRAVVPPSFLFGIPFLTPSLDLLAKLVWLHRLDFQLFFSFVFFFFFLWFYLRIISSFIRNKRSVIVRLLFCFVVMLIKLDFLSFFTFSVCWFCRSPRRARKIGISRTLFVTIIIIIIIITTSSIIFSIIILMKSKILTMGLEKVT